MCAAKVPCAVDGSHRKSFSFSFLLPLDSSRRTFRGLLFHIDWVNCGNVYDHNDIARHTAAKTVFQKAFHQRCHAHISTQRYAVQTERRQTIYNSFGVFAGEVSAFWVKCLVTANNPFSLSIGISVGADVAQLSFRFNTILLRCHKSQNIFVSARADDIRFSFVYNFFFLCHRNQICGALSCSPHPNVPKRLRYDVVIQFYVFVLCSIAPFHSAMMVGVIERINYEDFMKKYSPRNDGSTRISMSFVLLLLL